MYSINIRQPRLATFVLAMPRTGTHALSQLLNTGYCYAHHEGDDFAILEKGDRRAYEETASFAYLETCLNYGNGQEPKHYFCADQSCGMFLLQKAMRSHTVRKWIERGQLRLQALVLLRNPLEALFSMAKKCESVGLYPDLEHLGDGIGLHYDIIQSILTEGMPAMKASQVRLMIPPGGYEGCTRPREVLVREDGPAIPLTRSRVFLRDFLSMIVAGTGACGGYYDPKEESKANKGHVGISEQAVRDMIASGFQNVPGLDKQALYDILDWNDRSDSLDQSHASFLKNYESLERIMSGRA